MRFGVFAWLCLAALSGPDLALAQAKAVSSIYLAPNGDDARSGLTRDQALRSLDRVQQLLKSGAVAIDGTRLTIKFLPGTYVGIGVIWDYVAPGKQIVLEPETAAPAGSYPVVLDGTGGQADQFFLLRITTTSSEPVNTGVVLRGLKITNYCEGVSLGDWKSRSTITGNLIENNWFDRIGSKYETPKKQADGRMLPEGNCVAGVRVRQASGNVVRKNKFTKIENLPVGETVSGKYGPTLLHALYVSNGATDNRFEGNSFSEFTGSPVRIRAQSNDNHVVDNTFESPVYGKQQMRKGYKIKAVSQWYCNTGTEACRNKAEDGATECPSTGTEIVGNRVRGDMELYADESQSKEPTCAPTQRSRGSIEPRLERNTQQR